MVSVRKSAPGFSCLRRHLFLSALVLLFSAGNALAVNNVWTSNGPFSAVVNTVLFSSESANSSILAGSNGGGIFISADNGANWASNNNGISTSTVINTLKRCTANNSIYTGTNGSGVYMSTDLGSSWSDISNQLPANSKVTSLAIRGTTGTDLYAGINGDGIYKTTDSGATPWSSRNGTGLTNLNIRSLFVIPTSMTDTTILAGTIGGGIFYSTDDGLAWTPATGLAGITVNAITVDNPDTPTIYFAGTSGNGVYKSNNGTSWVAANAGITSATVERLVYKAGTLYAQTNTGLFATNDNGTSWNNLTSSLGPVNVKSLAIDSNASAKMYLGTSGGIYKTEDNGATWTLSSTGLSYVTDIKAAVIDYSVDTTIYAGGSGSGAFKSDDSGATWAIANSGLGNSTVNALLSASSGLYAGTNYGVYRSVDNAATWNAINNGLPLVDVRALAFDSGASVIYAGTNNGVYKTAEGAINWSATGSIGNKDIRGIAIDLETLPTKSLIYAGTAGGGVYKSENDGLTWNAVNTNLSNTVVQAAAADSQTAAVVYVGTANGLFKTPNLGGSWLPIGGFSATDIRSVAVADNDPTFVVAGTNTGVYLSSSSGDAWLSLNSGLPASPLVQSIAISSGTPRKLYAGLGGKGVASVTLSPTILVTQDVEPTPSTSLASINYGTVFKDTIATQSVKISNTGSLVLDVSTITIAAPFTWKSGGNHPCPSSVPFSIQPGADCSIDIDFSPTTTAMFTDTMTIVSNDINHQIALQGKSIDLTASIGNPAPTDHGDGTYAYVDGTTLTVSGTATATGTTLSKVQVSTNGGSTWNDASGTNNWTYSWTLPADGDYTVRARAVDISSISSIPDCSNLVPPFDCVAVKVNNIPPVSAITSPNNNDKLVGGSRTITGTASGVGAVVNRVDVSTDGGSTWFTATGTTTWAYNWTPSTSGTYIIQSRATDKDNKVQAPPFPTVTVIIDSLLPQSTITSPVNNAVITGASSVISGTGTDTGGSGLARIDISLDGETTWQAASGLSNWNYTWAIPPNTFADYFIKTRAVDGAGNLQSPATSIKVTVDNIQPVSTINAIPSYLTGTSYTFTGGATDTGVGVIKVEVSINGSAWNAAAFDSGTGTWSYPWTLPVDGTYIVAVRATDGINNIQGTAATVTAVVNNGAPVVTIVEPAPNAAIRTASYTISGTAADVGAGIQKVEVSIDGGAWNATMFNPGTGAWSYAWTLPSLEKSYTIQAKATDNQNDSTTTPAITVIYDISAPDSSIVSPAAGANLNGTSYTITGTALDPVSPAGMRSELQSVQISFNGGTTWYPTAATTSDWSTWSYNWILPLSETHLTIKTRAIDKAGNIQTLPFSAAINVYQVPPTSAITVPANGAFLNGSLRIITGTATDLGLGINTVEISTDGGVTWNLASGAESWSYEWHLPQDGVYTLMTRATDIVGYVESNPPSITVTVDKTPPDTSIGSTPPLYSNSTSPSFTFTASEPATFECKLDNGSFTTCTSPFSYSGLPDGSHTFLARAIDRAGNIDASPASYTWTVDTVQPQAGSASPADTATRISVSSPVTVTFSEAMDSATINTSTFTLDNGTTGTVTYNPTTNVATFAATPRLKYAATYTATITNGAKDLAGNSLAAPFVWTFSTDPDGDINHDGFVDIADAVYCLRAVVRGTALTAEQIRHGDVAPLKNGKPLPNGSIDIGDAVVILERVVGLSVW